MNVVLPNTPEGGLTCTSPSRGGCAGARHRCGRRPLPVSLCCAHETAVDAAPYPVDHEDDLALALAAGRRRVDVEAEAVLLAGHERALAQDEVERAPARRHQRAVGQINCLGATRGSLEMPRRIRRVSSRRSSWRRHARTGPPVCVQKNANEVFSFRSAAELKRTVPTRLACFVRDTMGRPPRLTLLGRSIDTVAVTSPCTFSVICVRQRRHVNASVGKRSYPNESAGGSVCPYGARGVPAIGRGDQVERDRVLHVERLGRDGQRTVVAADQDGGGGHQAMAEPPIDKVHARLRQYRTRQGRPRRACLGKRLVRGAPASAGGRTTGTRPAGGPDRTAPGSGYATATLACSWISRHRGRSRLAPNAWSAFARAPYRSRRATYWPARARGRPCVSAR